MTFFGIELTVAVVIPGVFCLGIILGIVLGRNSAAEKYKAHIRYLRRRLVNVEEEKADAESERTREAAGW